MTLEEIANKNKEIMEDNKLLLTDLCSRLPYHTMVLIKDGGIEPLLNVNVDTFICNGQRDLPKPYLRPMSSMTEEELNECVRKSGIKDIECPNWQDVPKEKQFEARLNHSIAVFLTDSNNVDWLNAHHFDYRGLINKGLAIEAPEDMYKTEKIMKKPDFEKDAMAVCFEYGIDIAPYQAAKIAEFFYDYGYGMGYADGTHDEKNHIWD